MIEFKIDYNREPWISKDWKSKHLIVASVHAMTEYMMDRAKLLHEQTVINDSAYNDCYKSLKQELLTILQILKDAGIEVVEK